LKVLPPLVDEPNWTEASMVPDEKMPYRIVPPSR
jgi:hypothetical protein